mmetsp:Transcript_4618/g.13345  ORF Transcript_4618/g.13345 Transcript_4618/m.13345 type:complete len:924 (+) Transcript_4618:63-2834(+)
MMSSMGRCGGMIRIARGVLWCTAVVVVAVSLAGCGDDDEETTTYPPPSDSDTTITTTRMLQRDIRPDKAPTTSVAGAGGRGPTEPPSATPAATPAATSTTKGPPPRGATTTTTAGTTYMPIGEFSKTPLSSFRNCYLAAPLRRDLGCHRLARHHGEEFGLNDFGQETTAKRECLARTRAAGGDTFVFKVGHCEVWRCASREKLRASAAPRTPPARGADASQPEGEALASQGSNVSFLAAHGKYLRSRPADGVLDTDGDASDEGTVFKLVRMSGGSVGLHMQGKGYVSALPWGLLQAKTQQPDNWEMFKLEDVPGSPQTVALKTFHEVYISATPDHGAWASERKAGEAEQFKIERKTGGPRRLGEEAAEVDDHLEVYSDLCEFEAATGGRGGEDRRAPIFVKLWEWNYDDIARECREYLGPNGFDAVQLSPVAEHIRGSKWWTKYQPISFGLNTRSGTAAQFKSMVAECRAAGVEVIVDLIINHIGQPCGEAKGDSMPCLGWNGSKYGNRRIGGANGWDAATPADFHHSPVNELYGACGVGPPDFLCGSLVTTDCSCCRCDMYGMPDWNTESHEVREIHYRHVKELHDAGIAMLRVDAALYENITEISSVLNLFPWDYVYMEWWGEFPVGIHDQYIGNYRDVALRWKITDALASEKNLTKLPALLDLNYGTFGLSNDKTMYPIAFHDQRTNMAVQETATYKNGLEFHQQQKFFLAWPWTQRIMLWGGFAYTDTDQGPPGCDGEEELCSPVSVFDESGAAQCMETPTDSPMPDELAQSRRWVCEHRWDGVAGLVGFRKACRGLPTAVLPTEPGRLGFKAGDECFVGLVRGTNRWWPHDFGHLGNWSLAGLAVGLPEGRYCDVASLPERFAAGRADCPREVVVGADGRISSGSVPEGDLSAIYTGAMLPARPLSPQGEGRRLRAGR